MLKDCIQHRKKQPVEYNFGPNIIVYLHVGGFTNGELPFNGIKLLEHSLCARLRELIMLSSPASQYHQI